MCRLFQFIIIDEFTCKRFDSIYFLTHWHSDHYQGISNKWPYGPIYSSSITKKLLLSKFPKLEDKVIQLQYDVVNKIKIQSKYQNQKQQKNQIEVRIFDSNHMAGSIMILLKFKQLYYLHTGDMRFNEKVADKLPVLFTKLSKDQYICNFKIQKLYLDNTFCDPIFMFPPRSFALKLIDNIILQYRPSRLFIATDSIGKEQVFIYLSKKYKTKVILNQDRYNYVNCMNINHKKYFSLNQKDGWIQSIRKDQKQKKVGKTKNSYAIVLTGWANLNDYYPMGYNTFIVPYSLHSNFKQLDLFVRSIRPKIIVPVVKQQEGKWQKMKQNMSYQAYMWSLFNMKQRGLQFFRDQYCLGLQFGSERKRKENNQKQQED